MDIRISVGIGTGEGRDLDLDLDLSWAGLDSLFVLPQPCCHRRINSGKIR